MFALFTQPDTILPLSQGNCQIQSAKIVIKPLASVLSCLIQALTLGLFTLVINAGMLYLTVWFAQMLELDFAIDNFWSALIGALIVSVISFILTKILR